MPERTDGPAMATDTASPRRVVVTGGASGIGRAAALALADQRARVVVLDIDDEAGGALAEARVAPAPAIAYLRADVSREDEVEAAIDEAVRRLGGIDVLITAAGIMRGQLMAITELDEAAWDQVVDVNLKGAFLACKHVARVMLPAGGGVMILVASKAGVTVGSGSFAYGSSKGGVHGLALTLDRHLGPRGIRVNDVCPGDVDTPLFRRSIEEGLRRGGDSAAAEAMLQRLTPPEDIAAVLAFLASDAASAVRGTIFTA